MTVADSPVMLSFPHFYLADPKLLEAVEGISPPDPEKHQLYIDVQPVSRGTDFTYVPATYTEFNFGGFTIRGPGVTEYIPREGSTDKQSL